MLIVVLDVNILASAAVSEQGSPRSVVTAGFRREFQIVISLHIHKKLLDTFKKPYFAARIREPARTDYLDLITDTSWEREPDPTVRGVAPDLEDDLVLGTAVAADADYLVTLVTGDKCLLDLVEYRGARLVAAQQFLEEMERTV